MPSNTDLSWVVHQGDSRHMAEVPDASVHLIVTSPPYNCGMPYDVHNDNMPFPEYLQLLQDVWTECKRVLVPGGRLCINVANLGRRPYIPVAPHVTMQLISMGLLHRGEIVWDRGVTGKGADSTTWGSWRSPSNPYLIDRHEYVLVFSKDRMDLTSNGESPDISKEQFMESVRSLWRISAENAARIGHPVPFPIELARRLIRFYSFPKMVVLDPFCGSGTTGVAAKLLGRSFIGYDISENYCRKAQVRIDGVGGGDEY